MSVEYSKLVNDTFIGTFDKKQFREYIGRLTNDFLCQLEWRDKILSITETSPSLTNTELQQINEIQKQLDRLVIDLYNLSPEELELLGLPPYPNL